MIKIRNWLIKKLGGHVVTKPTYTFRESKDVQRLKVVVEFPQQTKELFGLTIPPIIYEELGAKMGEKLVGDGFVNVIAEDVPSGVRYIGTIYCVKDI